MADADVIENTDKQSDKKTQKALKKHKRYLKTKLTKARMGLINELSEDSGNVDEKLTVVRKTLGQVFSLHSETIDVLMEMCEIDDEKFEQELNDLQNCPLVNDAINKATNFIDSVHKSRISVCETIPTPSTNVNNQQFDEMGIRETTTINSRSDNSQIDRDIIHNLAKIKIPKFNGRKQEYPSFIDAFRECVDKTSRSCAYKMLQLRQCLEGKALEAIEGYPATQVGYDAAKNKLELKFGGERRGILLHIDEIRQMKSVSADLRSLETFADKLELAILSLQEANKTEEFQTNSMFYCIVKSKLSTVQITHYKRWIVGEKLEENINALQKWLAEEVRVRTEAQEEVEGFTKSSSYQSSYTYNKHTRRSDNFASVNHYRHKQDNRTQICALCKNYHALVDCPTFHSFPISERWNVAKYHQLCFRCLNGSHVGAECVDARRCCVGGCNKSHHFLLHGGGYEAPQTQYPINTNNMNTSYNRNNNSQYRPSQFRPSPGASHTDMSLNQNRSQDCNPSQNSHPIARTHTSSRKLIETGGSELMAFRIIPAFLVNQGRYIIANVVLDDCSTDSYISNHYSSALKLRGDYDELNVSTIGGRTTRLVTSNVSFELVSLDGSFRTTMGAFTVDNVAGDMPVIDWSTEKYKWPHLKDINFPSVQPDARVDLLIGLNAPEVHRCIVEIAGQYKDPTARLTPLGWTCVGALKCYGVKSRPIHLARTLYIQSVNNDSDQLLRNMWKVETMGVDKIGPLAKLDHELIDKFENSMKFENNRYQVTIPWKQNEPSIIDNLELAEERFIKLEQSLKKRPEVANEYQRIINDQIAKSYMSEVPTAKLNDKAWYMPHFAVVRPGRETTKVRVVMDCAARHYGKSLNDCIYAGPKLQRDLLDVLIRFRSNRIAIAADITEMFLQIELAPQDRPYHRIIWRDIDNCNSPMKVLEYNRLVFGNTSSPFLSQAVIRYHAQSNRDKFPLGSESVLESMYVDDLLDSVSSVNKAVELRREISELLSLGGFEIRKWLSNDPAVLKDVPKEDRASKLSLEYDPLPTMKTLGLHWNASDDYFTYECKENTESILTKRIVVSKTATLFDPLGFLVPFIIRAKIAIQVAWMRGIEWDSELPQDLSEVWMVWFSELTQLTKLKVPRCLLSYDSEVVKRSLHTFVDASMKAYATVIYLRCEFVNKSVSVTLVAAKSRVAPLKTLSIPKLELCAAILGLRLSQTVSKVLNIPACDITYWSDSQNVLFWIRNESRVFKPFVAHRIGEIHDNSNPEQWRYVSTHENSADCATRGVTVKELIDLTIWWNGPTFLSDPSKTMLIEEYDESALSEAMKEVRREALPTSKTFVTFVNNDLGRLDPSRHSSWRRLLRITAFVFVFINNCRLKKVDRTLSKKLSVEQLLDSEYFWYRYVQSTAFADELNDLKKGHSISSNSKLLQLNPFIDEHGILRLNGRLAQSETLSYDAKFPIILPDKSDITRLIVTHYHNEGNHELGVSYMVSQLRTRYWLIHCREVVKSINFHCYECIRRRKKPAQQLMAPLPKSRLGDPMCAFVKVGLDYGGPFVTKQGRGKVRTKRYMCLFTCLATRAVHIEMAWNLDTESFLCAFDRFVCRRGKPNEVVSDNGTNFVGANRELKELLKALDQNKIGDSLANQSILWKFNPPLAPHFGGVFESMIKSAKRALKAVIGELEVTDEELLSAMVHAEGLINSRPLCYQTTDPSDEPVLTPNHFLMGRLGGELAPESIDKLPFNPRNRWRLVQNIMHRFWQRWMREILPAMNNRPKWCKKQKDLAIDDMVIVVDVKNPRGKWPLGRVVNVYPGNDGCVRVVDVKVNDSIYRRSVNRLCPLNVS